MSSCRLRLLETLSAALVQGATMELRLTPKPGLVDRADAGSHPDLSFDLMQRSIGLAWIRRDGRELERRIGEGGDHLRFLARCNLRYREANLTMGGVADLLGISLAFVLARDALQPGEPVPEAACGCG